MTYFQQYMTDSLLYMTELPQCMADIPHDKRYTNEQVRIKLCISAQKHPIIS